MLAYYGHNQWTLFELVLVRARPGLPYSTTASFLKTLFVYTMANRHILCSHKVAISYWYRPLK